MMMSHPQLLPSVGCHGQLGHTFCQKLVLMVTNSKYFMVKVITVWETANSVKLMVSWVTPTAQTQP